MASARFHLMVMGRPVLLGPGKRPELATGGKPLALLAYLLLRERTETRDHLAEVFWPDARPERARASLRHALWKLRGFGGPELVEEHGGALRVRRAIVRCDLLQLERALEGGDEPGALALWTGRPFEHFRLAGVPEWDRWTEEVASIAQERLGRALVMAADRARAEGRMEESLRLLEGATRVQPEHAARWLRRMDAELELRRYPEAQASLTRMRSAFGDDEDLAVQLVEREALLEEAIAGEREAGQRRSGRPCLVGRSEEFARLLAAWERAREGAPVGAAICGPAGTGKSHVLAELAPAVEAREGTAVILRTAPAGSDVAWALVADAVRALSSLPGAARISPHSEDVLRVVVPTLLENRTGPRRGAVRAERRSPEARGLLGAALVEALRDLISAVAEEQPLLLGVDDLDRADEDSRKVFLALWRRLPEAPVLLVVSSDKDPELPEIPDHARVDLAAWTREEVRAFLAQQLGPASEGGLPEGAAALLWRAGGGVPGATVELQELLGREGALRRERDGAWRLDERAARRTVRRWSAGRIGTWGPRIPGPSRRRRVAAVGGGVAGLALFAALPFFLLGGGGDELPVRYGGGVIYLGSGDEILEVRPTAAVPTEWEARSTPRSHVFGPRTRGPFLGPDGEPLWFERLGSGDERPWIRQVLAAGANGITIRTGGDVSLTDVSPDGRRILYQSSDPDAPVYRTDLWVLDLATGTHHRLYVPSDRMGSSAWSPAGDRIAITMQGVSDTLAILRPDGSELRRRAIAGLDFVRWCGSDGLIAAMNVAATRRMVLIDPATLRHRILPEEEDFVAGNPVCSPDGRAALYAVVQDFRPQLRLRDLVSGEAWDLPHDVAWGRLSLAWLPEGPRPVPERLSVAALDRPLAWGERRPLEARLVDSEGSSSPVQVEWESDDPAVVWVSQEGFLHANGVGRTRIHATWDGWLADTVEVTVGGEAGRGALLSDRFEVLDPARWMPVGHPPPRSTVLDGEPVLELMGDGIYEDGILLRAPLPGEHGISVEAEVRLSFTRRDRQRIRLCLFDGDVPDVGEGAAPELLELGPRQMPCILYPVGELARQDTTRLDVRLHPSPVRALLDVSAHLPFSEWTHLALQVRVDGTFEVLVDRELVYTAPVRLLHDPPPEWRVLLLGSAVDTRVFLRNLVVWPGLRYGRD